MLTRVRRIVGKHNLREEVALNLCYGPERFLSSDAVFYISFVVTSHFKINYALSLLNFF